MLLLLVVLGATTLVGLVWRARQGRVRDAAPAAALSDVLVELGVTPGARATLVQFSSAFCAPCRATRALLTHVAAEEPGVVHVEVDAEAHLELVRRLDVRTTPTTLVLDSRAVEVRRAHGPPSRAAVLAALPS